MVACRVHAPEVTGSNPVSAILRGSSMERTIMSGCHAPCDTDSNNSFFDGNEEMGVRFPPTQLIRISVLKLNMERWRNGRRGSYVQYIMFVMLTANLTAWGLLHCWFKSNSLQSRRWHKRPYKSIRCATWRGSSDGRAMI